MGRDQYIDIVEHQYFGNMALARPEKILPLLAPDAVLTGFFGASDARAVSQDGRPGTESFAHFLSALHADFALQYSGFLHFVDLQAERCACTFRLQITPRAADSQVAVRVLRNCNFFQFDQGQIKAVTAYFAAPPKDIDPWPATAVAPA